MSFSNQTKTIIGIAFLTVALAAMAAVGMAAVTDMANEQVQFDNESNLTVGVTWNESAASDATADVTVQYEDAYVIDNDTVTDSHLNSTTLSGTTAEFDTANVTDGTSYDVELDSSATTVTVPASEINETDGTVDLSQHTSDSLTSDDTILSATVMADDVISDSFTANPGNETNATYTEDDNLTDGTMYRVIVSADDTEADSVTVDDGSIGGIFGGSDGSPGFGVGVAIAAIGTAGAVARRKSGGS
ncbi:PGF-CTERM sorting domain-containing protein [Natrinema salinisoli]|uniref:PGF-CTERM sorting domain-containing protein n=1 Tax=Natrinema salinisoli TaxID=2878535 RepID=UPI001CF01B35|nr:PGF-CTERM sorting domain-containing protein [Natrinema salinisoli]